MFFEPLNKQTIVNELFILMLTVIRLTHKLSYQRHQLYIVV